MTAKDYLLQYREYDNIAKRNLAEYKTEAIMINDLIKNRKMHERHLGKEEYKSWIDSIAQFAKKVNDRAEEAIKKRDDILATLNNIPDLERDVLCARYIEQMKWEDIATKFSYSWHGIWSIHGRAIRMLQKHLDEKETSSLNVKSIKC